MSQKFTDLDLKVKYLEGIKNELANAFSRGLAYSSIDPYMRKKLPSNIDVLSSLQVPITTKTIFLDASNQAQNSNHGSYWLCCNKIPPSYSRSIETTWDRWNTHRALHSILPKPSGIGPYTCKPTKTITNNNINHLSSLPHRSSYPFRIQSQISNT